MRLKFFEKLGTFMSRAGREYRHKKYHAEQQKRLEELKAYFPKSILSEPLEGLAPYPAKDFKGESDGLYAYHIVFLVDATLEASVSSLVEATFPTVVKEEASKTWAINNEGKGITCFSTPELKGVTFVIFTNSVEFIKSLDALDIYPPPPWVSFPDVDPKDFRPNQGDREVWWYEYWRPFWKGLTPEMQRDYLEQCKDHKDWVEYLLWYGSK